MNDKDLARLKHMMDSTQAILSFIDGKKRADLDSNRLLSSAIIRQLEILGEAAANISKNTQQHFSELPWKQLIGMRNRLIHAYFDVDHDVIWKTVKDHVPPFYLQLQKILQSL